MRRWLEGMMADLPGSLPVNARVAGAAPILSDAVGANQMRLP